MSVKCIVPFCSSKYKSGTDIRFHKFPTEKRMLKLWCIKLRLDIKYAQSLEIKYVCSKHFLPSCYGPYFGYQGIKPRLRDNSLPTENLPKSSHERRINLVSMQNRLKRASNRQIAKETISTKNTAVELHHFSDVDILHSVDVQTTDDSTHVQHIKDQPMSLLSDPRRNPAEHQYNILDNSNKMCCVPKCLNRKTASITLHNFPQEITLRKTWLIKCRIQRAIPKNSKVCSAHFVESDYKNPLNHTQLSSFAIPSQNLPKSTVPVQRKSYRAQKTLASNGSCSGAKLENNIDQRESHSECVIRGIIRAKQKPFETICIIPKTKESPVNESTDDPCSVQNCNSSSLEWFVEYFEFPKIDVDTSATNQLISKKRREAWLQMIPLKCPTNDDLSMVKICSEHFVLRQPADDLNYYHVDWVPTLKLIKDENFCPSDDPLQSDYSTDQLDQQFIPFRENISEWIFGKTKFYEKVIKIKKEAAKSNVDTSITNYDLALRNLFDKNLVQLEKSHTPSELPTTLCYNKSYYDPEKLTAICAKGFLCGCGVSTETLSDLLEHTLSACTLLKCYVCHQEYANRSDYSTHFKNHTINRKFTCKYCFLAKDMSTVLQLQHLKMVHRTIETHFICDICARVYCTSHELKYHVEQQHNNNQDVNEENINSSLVLDEKTMCDICGFLYRKTYFSSHMRSHTNPKSHLCNVCGMAFNNFKYLQNHYQTHSKNPRFCPYCGKKFFWLSTFLSHVKKHPPTESIPLQCKVCRREFVHRVLYDEHQKNSHRKYECYICKKHYSQLYALTRHLKQHNAKYGISSVKRIRKKLTYVCQSCNNIFKSLKKLRIHLQSHNRKQTDDIEQIGSVISKPELPVATSTTPSIDPPKNIQKINFPGPSAHKTPQFITKTSLTCTKCNVAFPSLSEWQLHRVTAHKKKYRCKVCNIIVGDILNHTKLHRICKVCNLIFSSEQALSAHHCSALLANKNI